ncbi:MAG: hypothetical protein HRT57_03860 [Crocinitomicaceae bacterium]|nr:hypothetical protein [Crocinitomicaceae bacterium]
MINHSLKDKLVSVSIANIDFSFRIPVKKMGNTVNWRIGEKGTEGIVMKNVSTWTLQLFTKNITEEKYIQQFKTIVQEYAPNNSIDWKETLLAVNIQNEYNLAIIANATAQEKIDDNEILSILENKHELG